MTLDLKKLRQLAESASPGPWHNGADPSHFDAPEVTDKRTFAYWVTTDKDAAFIAGFNPATAIELLDEIERMHSAERPLQEWHAEHGKNAELYGEVVKLRDQVATMEALLEIFTEDANKYRKEIAELRVHSKTANSDAAQAHAEAREWKRRAEAHGCDVENGDVDCG